MVNSPRAPPTARGARINLVAAADGVMLSAKSMAPRADPARLTEKAVIRRAAAGQHLGDRSVAQIRSSERR